MSADAPASLPGLPDNGLVERLQADVDGLSGWLLETRRRFHSAPELGWQEIATTRAIVEALHGLEFDVQAGRSLLGEVTRLGLSRTPIEGEGDTGVIATFDSGRPGLSVCLRVDIDALPIGESSENHRPTAEGWASARPGIMHACGHDGHAAIGLAVARILSPLLASGEGKLMILFQPAEEGGRGGQAFVDAGWMNGIDLFLAVHIGLGLPSDTLAACVDGFLATRKFRAELTGVAAHAGKSPESGSNALLAACQAALGLHGIAQSGKPGVRVNVGIVSAGTAMNVVADHARLEFEIRASDMPALDELETRCSRMLRMSAAAYGVATAIELQGTAQSWANPAPVVAWANEVNRRAGAFGDTVERWNFGASEDATVLAGEVLRRGGTGGIFVLGADLSDGHHTPRFDFDESVLAKGVLFLCAAIGGALRLRTK